MNNNDFSKKRPLSPTNEICETATKRKGAFYAVARGRALGVYNSWEECERQVKGYSNSIYKRFSSIEDALLFISSFYENEEKQIKKKEEKVKEDIETIPKELNSSISINENKLENHHCNNNQPFSIDHLKEYSPIDEYHFVHVFTDGSCLPSNPGPGGFAALFIFDKNNGELRKKLIYGNSKQITTNNRMELSAIILALQFIRNYSSPKLLNRVRIYTDSEYVCMGITQWISTWKKNNWKTANNKDVKNQDLWVILDNLLAQIQIPIEFQWIKGHANDKFNEYVDQAAKKASQIMNSIELEY